MQEQPLAILRLVLRNLYLKTCGFLSFQSRSMSMSHRIVMLAVVSCLSLGTLAQADAVQDELKALEGTWIPASGELGGDPFPKAVLQKMKLTLSGNKYVVMVGDTKDAGTVKVDPGKKPKTIDITGTEGPNKGKVIQAIYEKTGDTLRVCYELQGKNRPSEFSTERGTTRFLVTYKKEAAKK